MCLDLKISVEEGMSLAGMCRIITDIQKFENDNLFSDQMFSNGRDREVVIKIVVLVICILTYRV